MIDKNKKFWTGDRVEDIDEYLREYSEHENIEVKPVICHECNGDTFTIKVDQDEGAIEIKCEKCKSKKLLLDSEEIWDECNPKKGKCPVCKNQKYNLRVGFVRRENGDIKHVFIGNRCTKCETLSSYVDWHINYGPTDEMEKNI